MFEGKKAFSGVSLVRLANVEELHGHVHAQSNDKAKAGLTRGRGVVVTPLEVSDGALMIVEAHYGVRLFGRPDENTGVVQGRTRKEETAWVPLNAFNWVLVPRPYSHRLTRQLDGPKVYVTITRSGELLIVLPRDVNDRPRLIKAHEGTFLDHIGFPNQDRGVFAS